MTNSQTRYSIEKTFNGIRYFGFLSLLIWIFVVPNVWYLGIALTIVSISLYLAARRRALKVERAYMFHLYAFLAIFPFTVFLFAASLWLFNKANIDLPNYHFLISGFVVLTFLTALLIFRNMFLKSKEENVRSGRLNANSGMWDLDVPLRYSQRQKNVTRTSAGCFSPLVITLAFYLGRNLEGDAEIFLRACATFIFGIILMIGFAAYQLAIVPVILRWEKEIGRRINISMF